MDTMTGHPCGTTRAWNRSLREAPKTRMQNHPQTIRPSLPTSPNKWNATMLPAAPVLPVQRQRTRRRPDAPHAGRSFLPNPISGILTGSTPRSSASGPYAKPLIFSLLGAAVVTPRSILRRARARGRRVSIFIKKAQAHWLSAERPSLDTVLAVIE